MGLEGTRLHLKELAQKSRNRFYAIDMVTGKTIHSSTGGVGLELLSASKVGRRSKSAVA